MRCSQRASPSRSELSLDALLHRLVEAAAELTGARYAALGVIDASGSELEQFLTHGIDARPARGDRRAAARAAASSGC